MKQPKWVPPDAVRVLHGMQLATFGGPAGIRDDGLLDSALARPQHLFCYGEPAPSLAQLAAAYAFGIVRNHPFLDGNKRTGLLIAFTFLELNGMDMRASEEDAYEVFMALAAGKMDEATLAEWLQKNAFPL